MVFGSKRETKPDSLSREDVVGNLYPDSLTSEVDVAQPASEFPRGGDRGNESVIDPHARFNGKYVSDRDLRIEGGYAFEWGIFTSVVRNRENGKTTESTNKVMRVLKRQPDGFWKVFRTTMN